MSARYGSRTRTGEAVSNFGQRGGAGGGGGVEVTASFSPAPAASVAPLTIDGVEYQVATITASTTVTFGAPATAVGQVLVVGGGGPGSQVLGFAGYPGPHTSGGGGGGGVIETAVALGTGPYPIVVGGGGSNSSAFSLTAIAGGAGGYYGPGGYVNGTGFPGGSGGGAGRYNVNRSGGTGTSSPIIQGFSGGSSNSSGSGAGGGAGELGGAPLVTAPIGGNRYQGGNGRLSSITGTQAYYGGGGNGTAYQPNPPNPGVYLRWPAPGRGGGGQSGGGYLPINPGLPGDANTGGGGGGAAGTGSATKVGGTGGSGIVIVRWQKVQA